MEKIESIKELRTLCQRKRKVWFWRDKIIRKFSIYITKLLLYTSITPNQTTWIMFLIGLISVVFFMKGEYLYSLIGLAIHHFYCLIDAVDGELARYKKVTSDKGVYLDLIVHIIINPLLIMGMAIGSYLNNPLPIPDISFLIAGFLGSYALLFMNFARIKKYELFVKKGDFKKLKEINKKHVLGNYNLFKKEVFFLIGFEIFNLMFIFVILNLVPYLVLIYAFVFTVLAIIKFIYNYRDIERII